MHKTSLYAIHQQLGAKLVPFAGWEMPIQYTSLKEEALAVRNNAGLFDVSHMGEFWVEGKEATKFIDYLLPNDIQSAEKGKAIYSPLCREDGTVVDDLIVYKFSAEKLLLCVNAGNIQKDWEHIKSQQGSYQCQLTNASEETSLIALQGPNSAIILSKLGYQIEDLPYYGVIQQGSVVIARTGYTGEDGFEIFGAHEVIQKLWTKSLELGATPCGLGARDLLRIEVGYPLYGHEIHDQVTPLDSALRWTVKFDKQSFIGKEALQNTQPRYRLVKLSLDKGIPREGYEVLNNEGKIIGKVTSGTLSVTLEKGVALAHIEKEHFPSDEKFFISIRGKSLEATYHKKPFVSGGHK